MKIKQKFDVKLNDKEKYTLLKASKIIKNLYQQLDYGDYELLSDMVAVASKKELETTCEVLEILSRKE